MNNVDITSVQHLIDVRNQLDKYAAPDRVDWHLACINNRWTKRALASAGFGYPTPPSGGAGFERWKPIFSVAEIGGAGSAAAAAQLRDNQEDLRRQRTHDPEHARIKPDGPDDVAHEVASNSSSDLGKELHSSKAYAKRTGKVALVHGLNRPLFHIDLTNALQSAIANVEERAALQEKSGNVLVGKYGGA